MQGDKRHNGPVSEMAFTSSEEHTQESPYILHQINGGTSLCILQGYVPFRSCYGDNSEKSESENIVHCHVLQPCKGKVP